MFVLTRANVSTKQSMVYIYNSPFICLNIVPPTTEYTVPYHTNEISYTAPPRRNFQVDFLDYGVCVLLRRISCTLVCGSKNTKTTAEISRNFVETHIFASCGVTDTSVPDAAKSISV